MELEQYRDKIANLSVDEQVLRDLYLRKLSLGEIHGPNTGYATIDKPWLKYYSENHIKDEIPHMTVYEYFKKLNANRLDSVIIDSMEGIYTVRKFEQLTDLVAAALYKRGVEKGKKILLLLPALSHESILFYATGTIGAALSQLPPQSTSQEVCETINDLDFDEFIVFDYLLTPEMEEKIYKTTKIKNIIDINFMPLNNRDERTISWQDFLKSGENVELPKFDVKPEDLLFIAKTGGSTGAPKSVLLSHNCFNIAVHQYLNSDLEYDAGDRWLRLWPLFSATAAVSNNHLPLCAGMHSIIRNFPLNINDFDKMVLAEKPEHLMLIPQLLDVLEKSELLKEEDLSYFKTSGCGGLAITSQFEGRVQKFYEAHNISCILGYGWGCTENSTSAAMRSNRETTIVGTVGAPQVKTVVSAFDPETLEEKMCGEEGELCIKSYTQMMGYFNDSELTSKVLRKHADGSVWLHTGDLGSVASNGIVTVKGRMTRVIFTFPTAKVYPSSLEELIAKIPGVQEVVIGQIPDSEHDGFYLPVCFIVASDGYEHEEVKQRISEFCDVSFAEHVRPKSITFKESFPRTSGEKTDIIKLQTELQNQMSNEKVKKLS